MSTVACAGCFKTSRTALSLRSGKWKALVVCAGHAKMMGARQTGRNHAPTVRRYRLLETEVLLMAWRGYTQVDISYDSFADAVGNTCTREVAYEGPVGNLSNGKAQLELTRGIVWPVRA